MDTSHDRSGSDLATLCLGMKSALDAAQQLTLTARDLNNRAGGGSADQAKAGRATADAKVMQQAVVALADEIRAHLGLEPAKAPRA